MIYSVEQYIVEAWQAYFKAPFSGGYRFFLTSDDNSELWISNTSNSSDHSKLNKIASIYDYSQYEKPYYIDSQRSSYINLIAGDYYLINAFRNQYTGGSHLSIAVEVPYTQWTPLSICSVQRIDISYNPIREIQQLVINNYKAVNQFKIVVQKRDPITGLFDLFSII